MKRFEQIYLKAYYSTQNVDYVEVDDRTFSITGIQSPYVSVRDEITDELVMEIEWTEYHHHKVTTHSDWVTQDVEDVTYFFE